MDDNANANQHKTIFADLKDHEKRITKLEVRQETLGRAHGELKDDHHTVKAHHSEKISKLETWVIRISVTATIGYFFLKETGALEKFGF
jgi:hypothetical protein